MYLLVVPALQKPSVIIAIMIDNVEYWSSKTQIDEEVDKHRTKEAKWLNQSSRKVGARTKSWKL